MKAISIIEPYATLIRRGLKKVETRGRRWNHRGELAIHASKGWPQWAREFHEDIRLPYGIRFSEFHFGCVIAIAKLVDCQPSETFVPSQMERYLGNYGPGRWCLLLEDVQPITPVPAKGSLGLWEWNR